MADRAAGAGGEDRPRVRDLRPGLDAREGHGRPPRRRRGQRAGAALHRPALQRRRRREAASRSSARASPSTPAASRSSRPQDMGEMKGDMAGGAAVIAAMGAIAPAQAARQRHRHRARRRRTCPAARAIKPGDVLKTMLGKTIEVVNTDAEGRLDPRRRPRLRPRAGRHGHRRRRDADRRDQRRPGQRGDGRDDQRRGAAWSACKRAAAAAGEKVWELPMCDEYKELIKSDVADMKNSGGRRRRLDHGGDAAARVRRRHALGPPRHRRRRHLRARARASSSRAPAASRCARWCTWCCSRRTAPSAQ